MAIKRLTCAFIGLEQKRSINRIIGKTKPIAKANGAVLGIAPEKYRVSRNDSTPWKMTSRRKLNTTVALLISLLCAITAM
jgi:hypothetical protein